MIWGTDNRLIAAGDEVIITCGALAFNYTGDLNWYQNDLLVETSKDTEIKIENTKYSYRKSLKWNSISMKDAGTYECRVNVINDDRYETKALNVIVHGRNSSFMLSKKWIFIVLICRAKSTRDRLHHDGEGRDREAFRCPSAFGVQVLGNSVTNHPLVQRRYRVHA